MVALIVTSLLVSILVSSLYYMFRVQDSMRGEVVTRESDLRVKAWFSEAVAGCLPVDINSGTPFSGSSTEIKCETSAALQPGHSGMPALVVFALKRGQGERMVLTYQEMAQKNAKPHDLFEWAAGEANFRYVNIKGEEMDHWPKDKNDTEVLPRLVKLTIKATDNSTIVWVSAMRNDPWIDPIPKNPFGIETLR